MNNKKARAQRNFAIYQALLDGKTILEISNIFKLHRERVRQIIKSINPNFDTYRNYIKRNINERNKKAELLCKKLGGIPKYIELNKILKVRDSFNVKKVIYHLQNLGYKNLYMPVSKQPNEYFLEKIKILAQQLNRTPNRKDLNKYKIHVGLIYKKFGSLRKAQELAGLKPNTIGHQKH